MTLPARKTRNLGQ